MFNNLGFGELIMMAVLGLVIFGPERLPKAASDAVRMFRQVRAMADSAMTEIKAELPPDLADLDLRSMNPRHLVTQALFSDDGRTSVRDLDADGEIDHEREARLRSMDGDEQVPGQTTLLDDDLRPSPASTARSPG